MLETKTLEVKRIRFFESPIQRHRFINDELIHKRNVSAIHTGRDDKNDEFYVEWREMYE